MIKILIILGLTSLLQACASHVQNTSGQEYLTNYAAQQRAGGANKVQAAFVDSKIKQAANVEPLLKLPARIGIARINNRSLAAVSNDEVNRWAKAAQNHKTLGELIPVNPFAAEYLSGQLGISNRAYSLGNGRLIEAIRLAAARQHLDAVLIYEVSVSSRKNKTALLSLADLTIIGGAVLPTRSLKAEGQAQALLLDVRNGYFYGSASTSKNLKGLSPWFGSQGRSAALKDKTIRVMTKDLIQEVGALFDQLVQKANASGT